MNRPNILLALCLLVALPASAQLRIEGQTFDAGVRVADSELRLNGVGLRAVAWLKGYTAALYLTRTAATPAQALAMAGPKRLQLRMLQDVPAAEFSKAFDKGVTRNTAAAELPALRERMLQFEHLVAAVGKVRKGDVVDLDLLPGRGLLFTLNGKVQGAPIAGDDLYAALLRVFLGDKPVDVDLKAGLLGGRVS
ncbi:MAG: chalcone isomerase family protein [Rubrivivax sp.]|nr:chalcone isomerase family protein [Rubrivivax sp.]